MVSLGTAVEIQIVRAVKFRQTFQGVFHAVAVYDVHDDGNAFAMGVIHQGLEFLRGAEAGAQGEEIAHLIAEGTIIRMLLQGHDLQGVVAQLFHARQHILAEFLEGAHLFLFRRHAYVAFINERMGAFPRMAVLPDIFFSRIPYLGAEHLGDIVLHHTGGIGRQPFSPAAGPFDVQLVQLPVFEEQGRNPELPVAAADGLQGIAVRAFPVVEVANQVDFIGVGRILAEYPAAVIALVQAVEHVVVHGVLELAVASNVPERLPNMFMPGVDGVLVRHEPGIGLVNSLHNLISSFVSF